MNGIATNHRRAALRFNRAAGRTLRNLVADLEAFKPAGVDISVFVAARDAAVNSEPMIVAYSEQMEIELMADAFPLYGVARPAIDYLGVASSI